MTDMGMTWVATPEGEGAQRMKVAGSLTIAQAACFKEALLQVLEDAREVRVDLSAVTDLDITALQLLCAAHGSAGQSGKGFAVEDGGNEAFRKAVSDAGFQRHVGCLRDVTRSCIWVGGES